MARVVITIEDKPNGNVKIEFTPKVQEFLKLFDSGQEPTAAETYALAAYNRFKQIDTAAGNTTKIIMPRQGLKPLS